MANKRLEQGKPLLRFKDLKLDFGLLQKTFGEISRVFADYPELFELDPKLVRQCIYAGAYFASKHPGSARIIEQGSGE